MVTTLFLYAIYGIVFLISAPIQLLPDVAPLTWFSSTLTFISSQFSFAYGWLPNFVTAMLLTWGIYLAVEAGIFLYKGIRWIYQKFPGVT